MEDKMNNQNKLTTIKSFKCGIYEEAYICGSKLTEVTTCYKCWNQMQWD